MIGVQRDPRQYKDFEFNLRELAGSMGDFGTLCFFFFDDIGLYLEVFDNELLSLGGIFSHVELEKLLDHLRFWRHLHRRKAHLVTDEMFEFIGRDFPETFESSDLGLSLIPI